MWLSVALGKSPNRPSASVSFPDRTGAQGLAAGKAQEGWLFLSHFPDRETEALGIDGMSAGGIPEGQAVGSAVQAPEPPEALGDVGLGLVGLWDSWDCLTCKWNLTLLGISSSRSPFPSAIQQYLLMACAFETTPSKTAPTRPHNRVGGHRFLHFYRQE